MVRATAGVVARMRRPAVSLASAGTGRTPRSPIAAAIVAISSGVASTLPWPIALEPTARSSPISRAGGIVERAAPASEGASLKPNRSAAATSRRAPRGGGGEPARAELRAERREDGVAGLGERLLQAAAAGLPVGVLELDALE